MTPDDWVFERQRDYPLSYVLTGADREYIVNERKSDHTKDDPEQHVQDRLDKLPNRIRDLIVDISLSNSHGRLPSRYWDEILDLMGDPSQYPRTDDNYMTGDELSHSNFVFGYKIGNAFHSLQNTNSDIEDMWMMWGFVLSVIGESVEQHDDEKECFSSLLSFFEERMTERQEKIESTPDMDDIADHRTKRMSKVHEILSNHGLDPNPYIKSVFASGFYPNPVNSKTKFCNILEVLLTDTPLKETNELERAIASDFEDVFTKDVQGVSAQSVFKIAIDATTDTLSVSSSCSIDRHTLHNKLDDDVDQKSFTRAIRFLAGRYDGYSWPQYPLLTKDEKGWKISAYGSLLAYCRFGLKDGTNWMYKPWGFPDHETRGWSKYVLPALNEISSESHDHQSILEYNPHVQDV